MATNVVSIENSRKHLTNAEKQARLQAESSFSRPKVSLRPPDRVKGDLVAFKYWRDTIKRMKGISLLDDLDTDMLAAYCVQSSVRDRLYDAMIQEGIADQDTVKLIQSQERLIISYANKLGLTPESRMRLAKKRAEEKTIDPDADMFGG